MNKKVNALAMTAIIILLTCFVPAALAGASVMELPALLEVIDEEAFCGDTSIGSVVVPEGTEQIRARAFADSSLSQIALPGSISYIADDAFEGCKDLEITAKAGTYAWDWAEGKGYIGLDDVPASDLDYYISNGGCIIAGYAGNASKLRIPDEIDGYPVTEIDSGAFYGNTGITDVRLPEKLIALRSAAFYGCTNLKSVYFPDSLKTIESAAFGECAVLAYAGLPAGLQELEMSAFVNCESLEEITAPLVWETGLDTTGEPVDSPFYGCLNLKRIVLLEGIAEIPDFAFQPSNYVNGAYMNYEALEEVVIPATVEYIGLSAFNGVTGLRHMELPEGLLMIAAGAFYECTGLESIDFPASLKAIESAAFGECTSLESLVLPEGLEMLEVSAFAHCTGLTEVTTPLVWETGVDSRGNVLDSPFYECVNLKRIVLCDGISVIPDHAFHKSSLNGTVYRNYDALEEVVIPGSVRVIGTSAFYGASAMKTVVLPEGVEEVRSGAFYGCVGLQSVTLPTTLKTIESAAFGDCTSLVSVVLPKDLETLEMSAFVNCAGLTEVIAPLVWETGLDAGGDVLDSPFFECLNLKRIVLYSGLEEIPDYTFAKAGYRGDGWSNYNSLEEIFIPATVNRIGGFAFGGCDVLTIYGVEGSRAESFANEYGFEFIAVEWTE